MNLINKVAEENEKFNKEKIAQENKNDNYIIAKIKIDKDNVRNNIRILKQSKTYKNLYNFEIDDFIVMMGDENIPVSYNDTNVVGLNNNIIADKTQSNVHYLIANYEFCIRFDKEGEYTIKIIFKKKLSSCNSLFYECKNTTEIDLSHFNYSEIKSCAYIFYGCINLTKIDFGKIDFNLSNSFRDMFYNCYELFELNVSGFNTKYSNSFENMFFCCKKLNKIDISNFNSSNCEIIKNMFYQCENITEIDKINWDMTKITGVNNLFFGYKYLNKIKMSSNFNNIENVSMKEVFNGISKDGEFFYKKGVKCKLLTKTLPDNWEPDKE